MADGLCEKLIELLAVPPAAEPSHDDHDARDRRGLRGEGRVGALSVTAEAGELIGVPPLPAEFVPRDELAVVCEALLRAGEGAVGVTGRGLGLHGQGGIGKTILAAAVAHDDGIRRHFPDGVLWVTLGESADLVRAQRVLLIGLQLNDELHVGLEWEPILEEAFNVRTATQGRAALSQLLAERQCLLVVDDVWSRAAAAAFRVTGPRGRVLYTTRDPTVLKAVAADVLPVDVLPVPAARQLLASLARESVQALRATLELAGTCGPGTRDRCRVEFRAAPAGPSGTSGISGKSRTGTLASARRCLPTSVTSSTRGA